jgi:hypothetical protein
MIFDMIIDMSIDMIIIISSSSSSSSSSSTATKLLLLYGKTTRKLEKGEIAHLSLFFVFVLSGTKTQKQNKTLHICMHFAADPPFCEKSPTF